MACSACTSAQLILKHVGTWTCRERALAAVKISQEDVGIIATEFEVDKKKAELRLREHDGNVVAALESFL